MLPLNGLRLYIFASSIVARFNFAHLVETYSRSFKFAQVIFRVRLVCLIELLTINAFKVSIFYHPQILQYLSKSDLIGACPQKMASQLCNVSEINDNNKA